MSKPVNPLAIGGFVVGGFILLIAGILLFGGKEFFKPKSRYVVFFDSSLNGLIVGAPVSMQGVQMGSVKEINIMMDPETVRILKPVVIEVDLSTLADPEGKPLGRAFTRSARQANLEKLIKAGLRARLETQSLLTGRLYVELNFYPGEAAQIVGQDYRGYLEVPSIPTRSDEIRNTLDEALRQFRKIPFDKIVENLSEILDHIREFTASEDLKTARHELAITLHNAHILLENLNRKVDPLVASVQGASSEMQGLMREMRGELKPLVKSAETTLGAAHKALSTADATLGKLQGTLESAESFTAPDSNLDQAVAELRTTARAVRELADYLERNPNSVIFGKPR